MITLKKGLKFNEIPDIEEPTILTGMSKFDQLCSRDGGQVLGTITLLTGTSGAGKTTLMVNLMEWYQNYRSSMYLREMRAHRIKHQTRGVLSNDKALISDQSTIPTFDEYMTYLDETKPVVVIVDSMQCIAKEDFSKMPFEDACDYIRTKLTAWAQNNNAVVFLIGHNTKEGEFAGKNTHMQMVDAHLVMEYDQKTKIRTMYFGHKNRSGAIGVKLYYEIQDGKIVFFTEEEYCDKLNPDTVRVPFVKAVSNLIKVYESIGKDNHAFMLELASLKKVAKNRSGQSEVLFVSEMVIYLNNLILKHGIQK